MTNSFHFETCGCKRNIQALEDIFLLFKKYMFNLKCRGKKIYLYSSARNASARKNSLWKTNIRTNRKNEKYVFCKKYQNCWNK